MKLYILRHEERVKDASFFAPLTEQGITNSNHSLLEKLESQNPTLIFCSPFIRTMQTIYPYSRKYFMQLNLDYALSDTKSQYIIAPEGAYVRLPLYLAKRYNYNPDYTTSILTSDIIYPESKEQVAKRIEKFTKKIIDTYQNTNENIIFVTHQTPCMILAHITATQNSKIKPDTESMTNYPMGQLSLIYDNGWTFSKIN